VRTRIPVEAFEYYVGLGATRSYEAVAKKYGVSKTAVVKLAKRECWQDRMARVERDAHKRSEERATESIEAMNDRHLRVMQVIQRKALEALKSMSLDTAIEAVRALDISVRQERLIRGEPSDRTELTTESILRREFDSWMSEAPGEPDGGDGDGGDPEHRETPDIDEERRGEESNATPESDP